MGKYIRNILASLRKADEDYSLIEENDKILVGISGGKDSLTLLKALYLYKYFSHKNYDFQPVFLDLGFGNTDLSKIKKLVNECNKELIVNDSTFVYGVLLAHQKEGHHIPCSICSRMKKAAMNNIANELHYNKVAFAHHSDDAIETLLMNMVHGGKVATFEPKMYLEKSGITFIRPLFYTKEIDIEGFVKEENIPVLESSCPANKHTEREWAKNVLKDLYNTHPEAKNNFRNLLNNYKSFNLPFLDLEYKIENTNYSLKPLINASDARGLSLNNKSLKENEEDFLIKEKGNIVGEISCRKIMNHRIEIFNLKGKKEAKIAGIMQIEKIKSKEIIPAKFVLIGEKEDFANNLGYKKEYDIYSKKYKYIKEIR